MQLRVVGVIFEDLLDVVDLPAYELAVKSIAKADLVVGPPELVVGAKKRRLETNRLEKGARGLGPFLAKPVAGAEKHVGHRDLRIGADGFAERPNRLFDAAEVRM